jgi:hypothetical protein
MYFLSAAYLLRNALIAERREEREAAAKNMPAAAPVAKAPAPAKVVSRPAFLSLAAIRPLRLPSGRTVVRQG